MLPLVICGGWIGVSSYKLTLLNSKIRFIYTSPVLHIITESIFLFASSNVYCQVQWMVNLYYCKCNLKKCLDKDERFVSELHDGSHRHKTIVAFCCVWHTACQNEVEVSDVITINYPDFKFLWLHYQVKFWIDDVDVGLDTSEHV